MRIPMFQERCNILITSQAESYNKSIENKLYMICAYIQWKRWKARPLEIMPKMDGVIICIYEPDVASALTSSSQIEIFEIECSLFRSDCTLQGAKIEINLCKSLSIIRTGSWIL